MVDRGWKIERIGFCHPPSSIIHSRPTICYLPSSTVEREDFTLYRGEGGKPQVVEFRCPHRQSQLSVGWVEGDALRCRFHGWKFNGSGQCIEQPAEQEAFTDKVRIRSYPTEESLGMIFVYFGEGAPPLPRFPDFEKDGVGRWR